MRRRSQQSLCVVGAMAGLLCVGAFAGEPNGSGTPVAVFEARSSATREVLDRARRSLAGADLNGARKGFESALAVLDAEGSAGAEIIEALSGLAASLNALHEHQAAISPARRALTLIRSRSGLYAQAQRAPLEVLVDSQSQLGLVEEAADDLRFLERVSIASAANNPLGRAAEATTLADWFCRVGDFPAGLSRHRRAIEALEDSGRDKELIQAKLGLARCSLHELSAQGIRTAAGIFEEYRGPIMRGPAFAANRVAYRHQLGRRLRNEGEIAARDAARIAVQSSTLDARTKMDTLLFAGDWFQLKGFTNTARSYYAQAGRVQGMLGPDDRLDVPVRVLYPIPPLALRAFRTAPPKRSERFLVVEFTVRADGTVETPRVIERNVSKSMVDETFDALRSARYRPRVIDGEPVAAKVVLRQSFDDPRELSSTVVYSNAE